MQPQAQASATPQNWVQAQPTTVNKLGDRIDGWADTKVGKGDVVDKVAQAFSQELLPHLKPTMQPIVGNIGVGGLSSLAKGVNSPLALSQVLPTVGRSIQALPKVPAVMFGRSPADRQHHYQYVTVAPGVTIIAKFSRIGYDLFWSWDLFVKRVWNEVVIGWVLLTSVFLWLLTLLFSIRQATATVSTPSYFGATTSTSSGFGFVNFLVTIPFFFLWLAGVVAFVAFLSFLVRRNPLAFFLKEMDLFEAHDLEGMTLSVHEAINRSLASNDIDTSTLRKKADFKRDRNGGF